MSFSLLVRDVDLTVTQELGLIGLRNRVWKATIARALEDVKRRDIDETKRAKCLNLINALATRGAARGADKEFRKRGLDAIVLPTFIVVVVNGMTKRMSDAFSSKLDFLPRYREEAAWSTTAAQEAAHVMAGVFRELYLCPCTWMHSLPVPVVAAVVEALARHPEANNSSWWLNRKKCRQVWRRALALCGPVSDKEAAKKVRAAFLMLVMAVRSASKFPDGKIINNDEYPLKKRSRKKKEAPRKDRLYMNEREVRSLIVVLKQAGLDDEGEQMSSKLEFQCAVARSGAATEDKNITQWCSYSTEEEQTIVTCASSLILEFSQVMKTLAQMAERLKQHNRFIELVNKMSTGEEDFAYPFLLAMLLVDGAMCLFDEMSLEKCCEAITKRVSKDGEILPIKRGTQAGSKKRKREEDSSGEEGDP